MPVIVAGIMRHCSQRESVLVDILGFSKQRFNKLSAAHIVGQIAEEAAPVRVITEVLNKRPAIRVGVRHAQFVRRGGGEALQQHGPDWVPCGVDDGFVGKNGIGVPWRRSY